VLIGFFLWMINFITNGNLFIYGIPFPDSKYRMVVLEVVNVRNLLQMKNLSEFNVACNILSVREKGNSLKTGI